MLEVKDLRVRYKDSDWVLKGVNLSLKAGDFSVIGGKSGCGKTTLARCLVGLIPSFYKGEVSGKIEVDEKSPLEGPNKVFGTVGFVSQKPEYHTVTLSVKEEIIFPLENLGLPKKEIFSRVEAVIEQLNLGEIKETPTTELSSGQLQKVAIASALSIKPKVLVLDEPLTRLDHYSAVKIANILKNLTARGVLVIVFEHHLDEILPLSDRVFFLENGKMRRVEEDEEFQEMFEKVDLPEISEAFLELKKQGEIREIPETVKQAIKILEERGVI